MLNSIYYKGPAISQWDIYCNATAQLSCKKNKMVREQ